MLLVRYSKVFFWTPCWLLTRSPLEFCWVLCPESAAFLLMPDFILGTLICFKPFLLLGKGSSAKECWLLAIDCYTDCIRAIGGSWKTLWSFCFSFSIIEKLASFLKALFIFITSRFRSSSLSFLLVITDWDLSSEALVAVILFRRGTSECLALCSMMLVF